MCIAIPMRIEAIEGPWAMVNARGLKHRVNIELTPAVKTGDYVLVHAGYAIERLEKTRAEEDLKIWEELEKIQELLAQGKRMP
jgi:hydrogenase expression/formation protein HypC